MRAYGRRRKMRGRGKVMDWLKKAHGFLRGSKLLSGIASQLGSAGVPYAGGVGTALGALGYGRRKRRGRGLGLAGGALKLAGAARRSRKGRFMR